MATISEGKQILKETVKIYLQKDERGQYVVPINQQRPLAYLGAGGIGKSDLVKQTAEERGIGFVNYCITHQTRQSSIGLPVIHDKEVDGKQYRTTEYTMSEIIGSVYTAIEQGQKEGILFIDEFNCASETLAPTMMQFLQNKTFGTHKLPEGWIIVVAGNPREYNKSVKELDMVTRDRLRIINLDADYKCWKKYVEKKGIHNVVKEFLENNKKYFYIFNKNQDGIELVTPRAWSELSIMLMQYEKNGFEVSQSLIEQFIQAKEAAAQFFNFYRIYANLLESNEINEILENGNWKKYTKKYQKLTIEKKWALISVFMQKTHTCADDVCRKDSLINEKHKHLLELKKALESSKKILPKDWFEKNFTTKQIIENGLESFWQLTYDGTREQQWEKIKAAFEKEKAELEQRKEYFDKILTNSLQFLSATYEKGPELDMYMAQLITQDSCCLAISKVHNAIFGKFYKECNKSDKKLEQEVEEAIASL